MQAAALYNDFGTLASLRSEARSDASGTLDAVAEQFESLFVQMMLKSMRDATMKSGLFDSHQLETYEQMYDQQLSLDLARQGGVGLADVIVKQLGGGAATAVPDGAAQGAAQGSADGAARGIVLPSRPSPTVSLPAGAGDDRSGAGRDPGAGPGDTLSDYRARALPLHPSRAEKQDSAAPVPGIASGARAPLASSPAEFVEELRPLAGDAARKLGVAPEILLAQAALETGWGGRVITDARGSSNNLFNIKAGADWSGRVVSVRTIEYRDGLAVRESADFRAYASPAEAFSDYVDLLRDNPRYAPALAAAGDQENYLRSLQAAGYATDPAYADKILAILGRDELLGGGNLAAADATLKKSAQWPLEG